MFLFRPLSKEGFLPNLRQIDVFGKGPSYPVFGPLPSQSVSFKPFPEGTYVFSSLYPFEEKQEESVWLEAVTALSTVSLSLLRPHNA